MFFTYVWEMRVHVLYNRFPLLLYPRKWKSLLVLEYMPSIIISMASDLEDTISVLSIKSYLDRNLQESCHCVNSLYMYALHNEENVVWKLPCGSRGKKIVLMVVDPWDKWQWWFFLFVCLFKIMPEELFFIFLESILMNIYLSDSSIKKYSNKL